MEEKKDESFPKKNEPSPFVLPRRKGKPKKKSTNKGAVVRDIDNKALMEWIDTRFYNYEEGIEELDEMDDLLRHLRMGNTEESPNLKKDEKSINSQKFSKFLKDIDDVYIDRESSPINQNEFEGIYGKDRNSFQPVVIEGKDSSHLIKGFLVIPGEVIENTRLGPVLGRKHEGVIPRARDMLDEAIKYETDDNEIADFMSDKSSNWDFDISEKELERLNTKSPNIRSISKIIDRVDEENSIRLAEKQEKIVSPDRRSHSPYNNVGLNFGGWRLRKM